MTRGEKPIITILFFLLILSNYAYGQDHLNKKILWTADWSSNDKYIAVGGNMDSLKVYSSKKLRLYKSFRIKNTISCVKWHPTKNLLAIATQTSVDKVRILNFDTGEIIELKGISQDGARGIDWNFSGELLAVADNDGQISIFDTNGNPIRRINHDNTKSITAVDWHPKKNIFVTVGDKIRIFDTSGVLLKTIIHRKEETLLLCVTWNNAGDSFVTGDYGDNQNNHKPLLQFWNANGDLLESISISKGEYRNIAWNRKGDRLASASDALRIWDKEGNLIHEGLSKDYLWGLSWNKKGKRIVTSGTEQRLVVWNNKARKLIIKE
jgi:WD40 repeat protein